MGGTLRSAIAIGVLMLPSQAAAAQIALSVDASEITARQLVERLRAATDGIIQRAGRQLRDSATVAVAGLRELSDDLERAIGKSPDTPVHELDGGLQARVRRGLAALTLAEDFAVALRTCVREDVQLLLAAFRANVERTVGDRGSWSRDGPGVLRVVSVDGPFPYAIRAGVPNGLTLEGIGLHSDDCGPVSASITKGGEAAMAVGARSHEGRKVALDIPPLEKSGVYDVTIRLRRRKLLLFCRSTRAAVSITVLPEAPFRIRYAVASVRATEQEIVWNAGELKQANEACDDVTATELFRLPEGWTYQSHDWIVYLDSGAVKEREEVRGNDVFVQYRVPGRGGAFCTGGMKLIHGKMEIRGTRTSIGAGPSIEGAPRRGLAFGESVTLPINTDPGDNSSIVEWSIDVRLVYPDGAVHAIPAESGAGGLSGEEPGGGSFRWDPQSRRLTISAPGRACAAVPQAPVPSRRD